MWGYFGILYRLNPKKLLFGVGKLLTSPTTNLTSRDPKFPVHRGKEIEMLFDNLARPPKGKSVVSIACLN